MTKQATHPVTADEAIARILKVDYLHEGATLRQMLEGYSDDAEIDHDNARIEQLTDDQKSRRAIRADICRFRCQIAERLLLGLEFEVHNEDSYVIKIPGNASTGQLFDMESVSNWAFYEYGIGLPTDVDMGVSHDRSAIPMRWEDVTIKIYDGYRIGVKKPDGKYKIQTFPKIGLMGAKHNTPNLLGGILIGLSKAERFPRGRDADNASKAAISKLRISLRRLTGIQSDPFAPFNEGDGWKPRFDLIDDRRNADERAKRTAIFVPYEEARLSDGETRDFEYENDPTQQWINQEEHKRY